MILHNSKKKTERLKAIQNKLQELTVLDKDFKIFGASSEYAKEENRHKYKLNPVLPLVDLMEFEKKHQLQLPLEYELYLTSVANGGAGPYYGLYSLEKGINEAESYSTEENESIENSFAIDFPYSNDETKKFIRYYNDCIADGDDDEIKYLDIPDEFTGVIFLSEYGCGWSYVLVVKGEQAGTVWSHGDYLCPLFVGSKQWSFFDWFEDWLDKSISELNADKTPKGLGNQNTILNYDGWKLKEIPEEVFNNKSLKKLVFSRNDLPEFPKPILILKELKTLDLSMTPIIEIPEEISELANLKKLKLNYNYHTKLPHALSKLEHLQELSMFYNFAITEIPEVVGKITNLKKLHFSHCGKLTRVSENIGDLQNLESLFLNDCDLLSSLPESLGNLKNLKYLYLGHTQISSLPKSIVNLSKLEFLGIDILTLDLEDAFEKIKQLPKLHTLKLINQVNFPDSIADLKSIKSVSIMQNFQLGSIENERIPLADNITLLENLEDLDLESNNQVSSLPESIWKLKKLKRLKIGATSIQKFPESMQNLTEIEMILGSLNKDPKSPYGVFPEEKEKLRKWFPNAKIWLW